MIGDVILLIFCFLITFAIGWAVGRSDHMDDALWRLIIIGSIPFLIVGLCRLAELLMEVIPIW